MQKIDDVLAGKVLDTTKVVSEDKRTETTPTDTSIAAADTTTPEGELSEEEFRKQHPFFSIALLDHREEVLMHMLKLKTKINSSLYSTEPMFRKLFRITLNLNFKQDLRVTRKAINFLLCIL